MGITSRSPHSIQARQPSSRGASTRSAANVSSLPPSILFSSAPVRLPKKAVSRSSSGPGMLSANSSLKRIMSAVCRPGCSTTPTSGGPIDSGAVHAAGAALASPRQLVVTMLTGPGFSSLRASAGS